VDNVERIRERDGHESLEDHRAVPRPVQWNDPEGFLIGLAAAFFFGLWIIANADTIRAELDEYERQLAELAPENSKRSARDRSGNAASS
jgi:hypothetical protein